ncbi:MAG: exo-alpha-sialidase [Candidatus Hydrogenedentes bacterium]|nr:exo-alpha-sialidase [Candidatus Hydrogenedentota bacterium]
MRLRLCRVVLIALLLSYSALARIAFTDPAPLNSNAATDSEHDFDPHLATDGDDTFVVVWGSEESLDADDDDDKDIIFSRSTNDGGTWSSVANLNNGAADDSDEDEQPDIAAAGSTCIVVWISEKDAGAGDDVDNDVFFSRSTNGGSTWSSSAPIHVNETADGFNSDSNPRVATDGEGYWVCVWSSTRPLTHTGQFDLDIVYSRSTDDGVTWSAPAHLNSNAVNATGFDYEPFVASNGDDEWIVVWHSTDDLAGGVSDDDDILVSYSTNDGQSWSDADFLNTDHAVDEGESPIGNEDNVQALHLDGNDWMVTWDRVSSDEFDLGMIARSTDGGQSWSPPAGLEIPDLEKAGFGGLNQFRSLRYRRYGKGAADPVVITSFTSDISAEEPPANKATSGNDYDIRSKISTDGGKTWTDSEFINTNAFSDTGDDESSEIACDNDGNIVIVWSSFNALGNTVGDADIVFARTSAVKFTELLTPNGGEKWKRGKNEKIKWSTNLESSEKVRLDLYRNGNKVQTIKNATPNDGAFKWKVPNNIQKGGKYQVGITLKSDASVDDVSLYNFNVK